MHQPRLEFRQESVILLFTALQNNTYHKRVFFLKKKHVFIYLFYHLKFSLSYIKLYYLFWFVFFVVILVL
jgi:hypothetical protein